MINRIASFHNYQAVQNDLRRQETKVHHNQAQLASGKKLLTPADNPLATHYIQNVSQQEEQLNQYLDAITLVRNRLSHQEVLVSNAEEFADDATRNVMEMINGALSPEDRDAHARELQEMEKNLLHLANSQDESGNYIFAGTKPKVQPFFRDNNDKVTYSGDQYQRKMRISNSLEMPFNTPGDQLLMKIDNPFGDFEPKYQLQKGSELLLDSARSNNSDNSTYKVSFVGLPSGKFGYQLEQDGSVVKTGEFNPKEGINYTDGDNSLDVKFKGQIKAGDQVTLKPRTSFSLFNSFQDAIEYSKKPVSDASATAELQRVSEELHEGFLHLTKARTDIGARLNTLDTQEDQHRDFKISLAKSKSEFEDLDYSDAVIEFNENSRALEASQKAFGKTKDLTLFNYI